MPLEFATSRPVSPSPTTPATAVQIAQAVAEPVRIALASPPQQTPGAPHVMTIQLAPNELGRVDIRIERSDNEPAKIQLSVERPETLSRLVHDQSQLQQALDQAGIPAHGRTIEFSLAPHNPGTGDFASTLGGNGSSSGGFQRSPSPYGNHLFQMSDDAEGASPNVTPLRSGIDITA